ncbi:MAG: chemotaxis protein [Labilithrix sp.]|nr:chemotaxis protein [Labilithrix sp.]
MNQLAERTHAIWSARDRKSAERTDRYLARLLVLEWVVGIAIAAWITPRAWEGLDSTVHPNVFSALLLGGALALPPCLLVAKLPSSALARHAVVGAQMGMAALLTHLCGGRVETHFLVFVSLASFSFYGDWRVFVTATLVVASDHLLRGMLLPVSVFGDSAVAPFRIFEHAAWVLFEDAILIGACVKARRDALAAAGETAATQIRGEHARAAVAEAQASIATIVETSRQFSEAFASLARRSSAQAASLQGSAVSTDQVAVSAKETARTTSTAYEEATRMEELACRSGRTTAGMLERMKEAKDGTAGIARFVDVIDNLSFQINILALNASVEAARAGEHGRGFAVVASEVRSLAEQSSRSAREIRTIVSASAETVDAGLALAAEASGQMTRIVADVGQVRRVLQQIAQASADQSSGIDHVARALQSLDVDTQQNARLAVESAEAAAVLDAEANELAHSIGSFSQEATAASEGPAPFDDDEELRLAS